MAEVGNRGAEDPPIAHAAFVIEVLVLDGDHGVAQHGRHLGERDDGPLDRGTEGRDQRSVLIVDGRGLRARRQCRKLGVGVHEEKRSDDASNSYQRDHDENPPEAAEDAPLSGGSHRLRRSTLAFAVRGSVSLRPMLSRCGGGPDHVARLYRGLTRWPGRCSCRSCEAGLSRRFWPGTPPTGDSSCSSYTPQPRSTPLLAGPRRS